MNYLKLYFLTILLPVVVVSQNDTKKMSFRDLTVDDGLSQNSVVSIAQDSIGYLWFATQDGLNKYDGSTFIYYKKQFEDITRPTFSKLGKIFVDRDGALWIISNSGNLEKLDKEQNTFNPIESIPNASCIFQNSEHHIFIGTYGNGLYKINHKTKDTIQPFKKEFKELDIFDFLETNSNLYVATSQHLFKIENEKISKVDVENTTKDFSTLAISNTQTIWLGTFGKGLYFKSAQRESFKKYSHADLPPNLNIQDLLIDNNNRLWVATYGDGVYLVNIERDTIQHFIANKSNPYALHYNDVLCLYQDYTGTIWMGTDGAGLSYFDEHLLKFNLITSDNVPRDVSVDVVRSIAVNDGTMWLGTSGKGLTSINNNNNVYKTYTTDNSQLSSNRIMSLLFDDGFLWIGHQGKGLQIRNESGKMIAFQELKEQTIWKIYKDIENRIWICTRDAGLIHFDKNVGIIQEFNTGNSQLTTNNIRTLESGSDSQLWIGTDDNGLFALNTDTQSIEKIDLIPDKIKSLYYDTAKNMLWIGTNGNGLKAYDVSNNTINSYNTDTGLVNNVIYAILPDEKGNLWLSSNKGITRFNMEDEFKRYLENFSPYSGLQAFEFNTGAYYKDENGQLYFGGLEGVNWVHPATLTRNEAIPKTVISKFEIFGKEQPITQNASFKHIQNTMTFTFSGLHFSQPERNLYRYKLVNHDAGWSFPDYNNVAHYTNLPPNKYTFMVLSSNYDGVWNKEPETFSFEILKPWYATTLAKILYLITFLTLIIIIYHYMKFRWEVKTQLRLEHEETERLKKLDDFKTKLYTNISHEFRTPLTLISGPIDHQLTNNALTPEDRKELNLIKHNADRLLNLVNQMVDLSLIDSGQLRLQVSKGNLNVLLNQIVSAFQYKADEKNIKILHAINNLKIAWHDSDIVEKIASNLLSNAIKYAPDNSEILVDANEQDDAMVLSVININTSVSQKNIGRMFQRFYQDDKASDGVGVGLALVKELVALSKGSIIANNVDMDKIQFTVTLPIHKKAFETSDIIEDKSIEHPIEDDIVPFQTNEKQPLLLIVEDHEDIRNFIISIFRDDYQILSAENGQIGINKALKHIPDLIISDVMMPIKDGIALCNELKFNELTCHIPIIILTAKVGEENELDGLRTGADAYMTKPFNSKKLLLRVEKLIENRRQLKTHFSKDFTINPEMKITATEADFLKRLKTTLDREITNPEFTSERFAEAMLMSRTQLHRKLKALVDMKTSEFIRAERLKLASALLKTENITVSEVAYKVGFNTPSYFIKCFKNVYNCTPNEYV